MVVDSTGMCIPGATVRVVAGQYVGESLVQVTPCDVWAYDGGVMFTNLAPGVDMTLVATAPGYNEQQKTVVPFLGTQMALVFTPGKK